MGDILGRKLHYSTVATKDEEGIWKVVLEVSMEITEDLKHWKKRTKRTVSSSEDVDKAVALCSLTMTQYLKDIDFDLFLEKGEDDVETNSNQAT